MVKKLMTGLAISVGACMALTMATVRTRKKGTWHPATTDGTMTPVTIRVHTAINRNDQARTELVRASDNIATVEPEEATALTKAPGRSAELAEIRVMIEALDQRSGEMMSTVNQRIDDLQNHLPR